MVELFRSLKAAGVPREEAFPKAEYEARLANVRKAMAEQDIDVLLVHHTPNFCYLTGYESPLANWYGCLIVPREGELIAQILEAEVANLMVHGWENENIHIFDWRRQIDAPGQLAGILEERGYARKRIGLEARLPGCNAQTGTELRELLPDARIEDVSDLVLHFRAVKSPLEMAHVREAARFSDIGMAAGLGAIAPGKTDNDVYAASFEAMGRAGSEYNAIQPLVSPGHLSGMVHMKTRQRALRVGEPVVILLSCQAITSAIRLPSSVRP